MEKTEKLQTITQISMSMSQSLQIQTPKRQSIRKRLSAQKSIEDFFKTYSNDLNNQKLLKEDLLKNKAEKKCFQIKKLVDLSRNTLNTAVEDDPFLRKGLKFLAKGMKENQPLNRQAQQLKPHFFASGKISYRNYQKKVKAQQAQMIQRVISKIGKEKFYA